MRTKVGIACEGGGSQTAFTTGVLMALSEAHLQDQFEFVSISGTSGGALCATLVWYALRKGETPIWQRLIAFWRDNTVDYEGKLDRSPDNVEWLIAHGGGRGRAFLAERARRVGTAGTGLADQGTGQRRRT